MLLVADHRRRVPHPLHLGRQFGGETGATGEATGEGDEGAQVPRLPGTESGDVHPAKLLDAHERTAFAAGASSADHQPCSLSVHGQPFAP